MRARVYADTGHLGPNLSPVTAWLFVVGSERGPDVGSDFELAVSAAGHRIFGRQSHAERFRGERFSSHLGAVLLVSVAEVGDLAPPVRSEQAFVADETRQGVFADFV